MKSEFLATKKKNQLVFFSLGIFKFLVLFVFLTSVVDWTGCLLDGCISRMPLSFKLLSIDTKRLVQTCAVLRPIFEFENKIHSASF